MIAVVTNYYNPSGNPVKYKNYLTFRENIKYKDFYVIEASFGDKFELESDFKVMCKDVIWQQYTLVNMISKRLPDKYDKILWVDADILFENDFFAEEVDDLLDEYKIVQCFSSVNMMSKGNVLVDEVKKGTVKDSLEKGNLSISKKHASGFSWGVRRDIIEKFGIYNYWITGSSDIAFCIGVWGDWNNEFFNRTNVSMRNHYMEWAIPFNEYVGMNVGYLDGSIKHLWHGYRNYRKRWDCLKGFDPYNDVKITDNGLEWCSYKPCMHKCCKNMCMNYDIDFKLYS